MLKIPSLIRKQPKAAVFVAATAQHVGKTTTCLGMVSGLKRCLDSVGFIKPVGQRHVVADEGISVDKDVVLFKEQFQLKDPYPVMSPVILPTGFTRRYLDGKVAHSAICQNIVTGFEAVCQKNTYTIVEGTGHSGVGSIIDLSNADVAKMLGLEVILVTTGGIGAAFDQLALNLQMFRARQVKVRGIIINRVFDAKREMVIDYMTRAIKKWNIPLAGCIPYCELLSAPSMVDYQSLFQAKLLAGKDHQYRHFTHERLVATSVQHYRERVIPNQLIITPATREDIVRATLKDELKARKAHPDGDLERGMILTGQTPPSTKIIEEISKVDLPVLYAPVSAYRAMTKIAGFVAKLRREDVSKVDRAIDLVEKHLDFDIITKN